MVGGKVESLPANLETELMTKMNSILLHEESFWKQKARVNWITQ